MKRAKRRCGGGGHINLQVEIGEWDEGMRREDVCVGGGGGHINLQVEIGEWDEGMRREDVGGI